MYFEAQRNRIITSSRQALRQVLQVVSGVLASIAQQTVQV